MAGAPKRSTGALGPLASHPLASAPAEAAPDAGGGLRPALVAGGEPGPVAVLLEMDVRVVTGA